VKQIYNLKVLFELDFGQVSLWIAFLISANGIPSEKKSLRITSEK